MKKIFLITAAIFLLINISSKAQQLTCYPKTDKQIATATYEGLYKIYNYRPAKFFNQKNKLKKWNSMLTVKPEGYTLGQLKGSRSPEHKYISLVNTCLTGNCTNFTASRHDARILSVNANGLQKINTGSLTPPAESQQQGSFDCGMDGGSGLNIGLSRSACINLDFGDEKETDSLSDVTEQFAESDNTPDLDISIGLLIGLR